jgi:hypothetical protein
MWVHTFMLSDIFCRVSGLCDKYTHTIVERLESNMSRCKAGQTGECAVDTWLLTREASSCAFAWPRCRHHHVGPALRWKLMSTWYE